MIIIRCIKPLNINAFRVYSFLHWISSEQLIFDSFRGETQKKFHFPVDLCDKTKAVQFLHVDFQLRLAI